MTCFAAVTALLAQAAASASGSTPAMPPPQAPAAAPASVATPTAPDPARLAAARAFVDTILPPAGRREMFERALTSIMGNMIVGIARGEHLDTLFQTAPEARPIFERFVERQRMLALNDLTASEPQLMDAYAQAYARQFSVADLAQLRAFFSTPLGERYRVASVGVLSDPAFAAWSQGVAERAQRRIPEETQRFRDELAPVIARHHTADHPS